MIIALWPLVDASSPSPSKYGRWIREVALTTREAMDDVVVRRRWMHILKIGCGNSPLEKNHRLDLPKTSLDGEEKE
jgi:hypothetical protein